jgi:Protein of unknown function (DUF3102)
VSETQQGTQDEDQRIISGSSAPTENIIPLNVVDVLTPEERENELDRIKIKELHEDVCHYCGAAIGAGIEIGEILTRRKERVGHVNWIPWLEANAPFTEATACNYMRLFKHRDWLVQFKDESKTPILDLTDAYRKINAKIKAEEKQTSGSGDRKSHRRNEAFG